MDGVVSDITTRKETELALEAALRKADRIARRRRPHRRLQPPARHRGAGGGAGARRPRRRAASGCCCSTSTTSSASTTTTATAAATRCCARRAAHRRACAATTPSAAGAARSSSSWCPAWPTRRRCARRGGRARAIRPRRSRSATSWCRHRVGRRRARRRRRGPRRPGAAADRALYAAKRRGRDRVELASEVGDTDCRRRRHRGAARRAGARQRVQRPRGDLADPRRAGRRLAALVAEELALPRELSAACGSAAGCTTSARSPCRTASSRRPPSSTATSGRSCAPIPRSARS